MMTRCLPFLLLIGACVAQGDNPSLNVSFDSTNAVGIQLERGDSHVFNNIQASANGIDCGSAEIISGSTQIGSPNPATATFTIDLARLGASADIVVVEDGERFEVVAPTLGTSRSAQIVTPLTAPLVSGETVESTTGVAGDQLYGYFNLVEGQTWCVVGVPTTSTTPSISMPMPADLASAWQCGAVTPGSLVQASLALSLSVSPEVTTCDGNSLTCNVSAQALSATAPVQLQF
jgi:hypothetical protein